MFKPFIAQVDTTCDDCSKELPRGSHCYLDDCLVCEDCFHERESDDELDQRYEENFQLDEE